VAGKAAACAFGAVAAPGGRWLAFVDADVVLAPEALSRLLAACLGSGAVAASPLARQATRAWWEELLLPDLGLQVAERLDLSAWRRSREAIRERSANRAFDLLRHRILLEGNKT
jgi:glycosyltransferase involved in cell wall biosynthesis